MDRRIWSTVALAAALGVAPAIGAQDTTSGSASGAGRPDQAGPSGQTGTTAQAAMSRHHAASSNYGLSADEITQLQAALSDAGCSTGTADGVLGPKTRQALACAKQKKNVNGNNPNEIFRSLNLAFTTPDSNRMGRMLSRSTYSAGEVSGGAGGQPGADVPNPGMSGRQRPSRYRSSGANPSASNPGASNPSGDSASAARQAVHGDSGQVGGQNQGRIRPPHDSTNHSDSSH